MIGLRVPIPTVFITAIPQPPSRVIISIIPLPDVNKKLKILIICRKICVQAIPHKAQITSYVKASAFGNCICLASN